ncbi:hypothetical protein OPQ81_002701, partial [Rhizoctonia solani]
VTSKKAIEYESRALALTPDGHPDLPSQLANLAVSLSNRFGRLGELGDLEKAIEYESRALALTPDGHPTLSSRLANLAVSLSNRFDFVGELGDLEKAIEYQSRALTLTPDGHPALSRRLANLAVSLRNRFDRLGRPGDLEKAIDYESQALALTPDGHPALPSRLANLAVSLRNRFDHLGELSDLEKAIDNRFGRLGELGDLEKAIEYESQALALTPEDHPDLSRRLTNLAVSLGNRFDHLGELGDLEKAVEYESRALELTPDGHPDLLNQLDNLAMSLINRFDRLGELVDLKKAIEYQSRALALTPDGHPDMSRRLTNLAVSLSNRFDRLGELALPSQLANLAISLGNRFDHLSELGDLEKAIECQSRALALTPDGHPDLSRRLTNLAVSLGNRFDHLGELGDLEKAVKYQSQGLALTPDGHPSCPLMHFTLATLRLYQYQCTTEPSLLQDSLHSFRTAAHSLAGSPRQKFQYAVRWTHHALLHSSLNCLEAYQTAIDLLPQFIWFGATTNQRYLDLEQTENLAVQAAYAAMIASEYTLALEWLEHARCVVWNQNLMLRSPLDQLLSCDPALATRLQTVAARLHHAGSESQQPQALRSSLTPEQVAQERRQLAQEYNDLITQARTRPGFEDFLRPIKAKGLVGAARHGPIVVINCHENRCDALLITPGKYHVAHVALPNFTGKKAHLTRLEMEQSVRNSQQSERGIERRPVLEDRVEFESVLTRLWYDVVKPVLDSLGYTKNLSSGNLPHITWCPTGAISFLPLHAAGDYVLNSKVFDYVISSYTPTLAALLSSAPSCLTPDSHVLTIGQPNTPGHSALPGTAEELAYVKNHTSGRAKYTQLVDKDATTIAVLDAMQQHDWVHLACHAHQNVSDPTESGFFLHDGTLDLAKINQQSFKKKGLAYLSACQTATGDKRLPDEAVHLASGMLMAGYSSVIATMWSVVDDDAPLVADRVYGELMKKGTLGSGEAGKSTPSCCCGFA